MQAMSRRGFTGCLFCRAETSPPESCPFCGAVLSFRPAFAERKRRFFIALTLCLTAAAIIVAALAWFALLKPYLHRENASRHEAFYGQGAELNEAPALFSTEEISYFMEIAFGSEFNGSGQVIRKWQGPVRIEVFGTPTAEDRVTLNSVLEELNELVAGAITLTILESENESGNVIIYFVPESSFADYLDDYTPLNYGFFWTWWNSGHVIYQARILISTEGVTQQERSHLIREELTQSLGLMQDSWLYSDSIFYQGWTNITDYSALDRAVIQILYLPEVEPGMSVAEVMEALYPLTIIEQQYEQRGFKLFFGVTD